VQRIGTGETKVLALSSWLVASWLYCVCKYYPKQSESHLPHTRTNGLEGVKPWARRRFLARLGVNRRILFVMQSSASLRPHLSLTQDQPHSLSGSGQKRLLGIWFAMLFVVVVGELLPGNSAPVKALTFRLGDKALHMSAYTALAAWPAYTMRFSTAAVCILSAECMGIALEFAQRFVPNRSFELYDMGANSIGIVLGIALGLLLRFLVAKTRSRA
jgi:VanZ family protein